VGRRIAALALGLTALLGVGARASASDLEVSWNAPRGCLDRDALRQGLSRRVGREVAFGSDAQLGLSGTLVPRGAGYELDLETVSPAGTERRTLQARTCSELARATLLIAALLLSDAPDAPAAPELAVEPSKRTWFVFARAGVIGDLGSLASVSVGPGLGVGLGVDRTLIELGGLLLPSQELRANALARVPGTLRLMAANASVCHEFFDGPRLAPCLHFEAGSLRGRGRELANTSEASATWLSAGLGARARVRLFDELYGVADVQAGVPLVRPRFGVHGVGPVHEVPPLIGRLELSLEGRL